LAVSIFVPLRKQLALHIVGGQANAAVLARTRDPKIAPNPTMFRRVRREVSPESFRSVFKIVRPLISPKCKGDYFCAVVNSFPKKEVTLPEDRPRSQTRRRALATTCANPTGAPVQPEATGRASRRRPSTGGSSQRPLDVDSRPSIARREPALGSTVLAARWRPRHI
jgi:hypothetical protein